MDTAVPEVLRPAWLVCASGLPMMEEMCMGMGFCSSDLGDMTLTLGFLWKFLCSR